MPPVPEWLRDNPDLKREDHIKHIPVYNCQIRSLPAPRDLSQFLGVPSSDGSRLASLPAEDWIVVSIDFEDLCMGRVSECGSYRYKPITEVGISFLDTREIRDGIERHDNAAEPWAFAPMTGPGDRGVAWKTVIRSAHWRVKEFQTHFGHCRRVYPHVSLPYHHAFGKSKLLGHGDIAAVVGRFLDEIFKRKRTAAERQSKSERNVVFFAWDTQLEEKTLARLGLNHFQRPTAKLFDFQRHPFFQNWFGREKSKMAYALEVLGIRFIDAGSGDLTHNASNDAGFQLQAILAAAFLSEQQRRALFSYAKIRPWLPFSWVGYTIHAVDLAPGTSARDSGRRNDNAIPQPDDPKCRPVSNVVEGTDNVALDWGDFSDSDDEGFYPRGIVWTSGGG